MYARTSFALAAALVVLVSGCDRETTPLGLDAESVSPSLSAHGGWVAKATGSGHTPFAGGIRVFTFTATEKTDGSVNGRFRIGLNAIDAWFSAEVTCVSTAGNTAWVGGVIDGTNVPDLVEVGSTSEFWVTDNGEGTDAPADIVSTAAFNGDAGDDLAFCAAQPLVLPPRVVEQGNVQVAEGP